MVAFFILDHSTVGFKTTLRLSCHIWKLIMQLGQPQSAFVSQKESSVGRMVSGVVNWGRFAFTSWLA